MKRPLVTPLRERKRMYRILREHRAINPLAAKLDVSPTAVRNWLCHKMNSARIEAAVIARIKELLPVSEAKADEIESAITHMASAGK